VSASAAEPAGETRAVVEERDFPHPPEKLWRALTAQHLIADWLMANDFVPVVGHRFTLTNRPRPDITVVIEGEVLAVEPPRTLTYTWNAYDLESVVTWTLTPIATGTRLRLEQRGFRPNQRAAFKGARAAWHAFFTALEGVLGRGWTKAGEPPRAIP
jgi:uncharacterized protein YndB with AHSA1/START domain